MNEYDSCHPDVCTPRTEVTARQLEKQIEKWKKGIYTKRYLVYEDVGRLLDVEHLLARLDSRQHQLQLLVQVVAATHQRLVRCGPWT